MTKFAQAYLSGISMSKTGVGLFPGVYDQSNYPAPKPEPPPARRMTRGQAIALKLHQHRQPPARWMPPPKLDSSYDRNVHVAKGALKDTFGPTGGLAEGSHVYDYLASPNGENTIGGIGQVGRAITYGPIPDGANDARRTWDHARKGEVWPATKALGSTIGQAGLLAGNAVTLAGSWVPGIGQGGVALNTTLHSALTARNAIRAAALVKKMDNDVVNLSLRYATGSGGRATLGNDVANIAINSDKIIDAAAAKNEDVAAQVDDWHANNNQPRKDLRKLMMSNYEQRHAPFMQTALEGYRKANQGPISTDSGGNLVIREKIPGVPWMSHGKYDPEPQEEAQSDLPATESQMPVKSNMTRNIALAAGGGLAVGGLIAWSRARKRKREQEKLRQQQEGGL